MDITSLKYFEMTAREQHMGRAAEKLHITQPSLSAAIRRLETEIGYPLFNRVGRGIELNEYGKMYLTGVSAALSSLDKALDDMEEYKQRTHSLVRLSCSGSSKNTQLIEELLDRGFLLKISAVPSDLETALASRQCDLIITMGKSENERIGHAQLELLTLVFVVGKSHPLAKETKPLTLDKITQYRFCSTDTPNSLLNVFKETTGDNSFEPAIAFYGRNSSDLLRVIETGKYVGLMVKEHLPVSDNICVLPVSGDPCVVPMYLHFRKGSGSDSTVRAVKNEILAFYAAPQA
ncbi:MAG: LysR family transcriptional regulator [Lachnospiraceae bacterium]|nr:LysR family transcriptional regulator [Lachnospiraceae bacterium]